MSNTTSPAAIASSQLPANPSNSTTDQQALLRDVLKELQDLNASTLAQTRLKLQPPNEKDFIWTCVLQFSALVVGVLFGVFAILAWVAAQRANSLASDATDLAGVANCLATAANNLALLSYCASSANASIANACAAFQNAAVAQVQGMALSLADSSVEISSASCNGGSESPSSGAVSIGGVVGGVVGGSHCSSFSIIFRASPHADTRRKSW